MWLVDDTEWFILNNYKQLHVHSNSDIELLENCIAEMRATDSDNISDEEFTRYSYIDGLL